MQVLLSTIRSRVRERGNYENSARYSDSFINDRINVAGGELYELLSSVHQGYFDKETTLVTVAGTDTVDLPADFWRLRGLDVQYGGRWFELNQIGIVERNRFQLEAQPRAFRVVAGGTRGSLKLYPTPDSVYTLRLIYEPTWTPLSADTDVVEDFNGWVDYIVAGALLHCAERMQMPLEDWLNKVDRAKARVISGAGERRAAEPEYLVPRGRDHDPWWGH